MSAPIFPFDVWQSGTLDNSVPANDNALRTEILCGRIISDVVSAQPVSPTDGDAYIIPESATGAQWSLFNTDDLSIYYGGTWYAYAPTYGTVVNVDAILKEYRGSDGWVSITSGGDSVSVITESGASVTMSSGTHSGLSKYVRITNASASISFDDSEGYASGDVFNIRIVGTTASIVDDSSITLNVPYGGTLSMVSGMSVTVVFVSDSEADIIGQTIPEASS